MADQSRNDLPYGIFGQATYDPEDQDWSFGRSDGQDGRSTVLGEPRVVSTSSRHEATSVPSRSTQPSTRHPQEVKAISKYLPELQPANELLPACLRLSEVVQGATARHDAQNGGLLSLGTIPSEASGHPITVAAFACGSTGSDLRLVHVQTQRRGWDDTRNVWIEFPTVHGESAIWSGPGAPIQQICFATAMEGSDGFLAVRMLAKTLLFRPRMRRAPRFDNSASRLDANLGIELSLADTGQMPHADVAFNPWYTRQCAVVDQAGNWSIWDLEGRRALVVKRVCWSSHRDESRARAGPLFDGWARIRWVANLATIIVCSRSTIYLCDIEGGGLIDGSSRLLEITGTSDWILDVASTVSQPAHLFVLTSRHILVYHVSEASFDQIAAADHVRVKHFRNIRDITLRLSAFAVNGGITLILGSDFDSTKAVYKVTFDQHEQAHISMPSPLHLVGSSMPSQHSHSVAGLHLGAVPFGASRQVPRRSLALDLRDSGVIFTCMTVLNKDFTLQQSLLYSHSVPGTELAEPTWQSRLGITASQLRKDTCIVEADEDLGGADSVQRKRPVSAFRLRKTQRNPRRAGASWALPWAGVVDALQTPASSGLGSIEDVLHSLTGQPHDSEHGESPGWRLLVDLLVDEITVPDFDKALAMLQSLCARGTQTNRSDAQGGMALPQEIAKLATAGNANLRSVHAAIVRAYITPLPASVSGRVRLAKEQLARRMAAEVTLASLVLRPVPQDSRPQTELDYQSFDLPVRAGPVAGTTFSSEAASHLSALPTPSPSATPAPSTITSSSHPSSLAAPEISRLSRYTTISKPSSGGLPRSLNNVLAHWTLGANPEDYDWRTTSKRLVPSQEQEDEQRMPEKERQRVQKRAERHLRRQRKEAEASRRQMAASSQVPGIASASQPQPQYAHRTTESQLTTGAVGSSQGMGYTAGQGASQIVPGRFGGRPPPQKKRRKQGF
ncbi:hypothetical protein LTR62_001984 [Meristemomyces frigidus]|uniref:RNA polymerase I-specific transcription initiation factor RRN6-like protein n=1 Tax=Meristemomyces frigidus TaxID=1508187 RepID=A0AAN7YSB3_9PEZI|nr:hypothetical protein LTR62_001984 [Meristemomyces frigidus]